ncbi:SURF1 family protein [Luteimonas abyssi]|uniref:SURF1 family protein n=1 Tax=Luteimonas abyssi TaxID=1247514 RepID=UPI000737D332|nr:SURF1 family protein [Luteimonas abyssi]
MTGPAAPAVDARPRRPVLRIVFAAALAAAFVGFVALGIWQVQRLAWKQDLIERVDARIHAAPEAPPPRSAWAALDEDDAYRRVHLRGEYLPVDEARTQAVTEIDGGWWLLAPLRTEDGDIVLVNRGFVPLGEDAAPPPAGPVEVTGLLRITEPGGGFLRSNDPAEDRWHSRDVAAIGQARGLDAAALAPYFVDAERDPAMRGWPRGGMTVVRFRDHHLQYALTWFAMALLTVVAGGCLVVLDRRLRHHRRSPGETHAASDPGPSPPR